MTALSHPHEEGTKEEQRYNSTHYLRTRWRWAGHHHTPTVFSLGKTPVPIGQEAEWAPELVQMIQIKEKFLPCQQLNPGHPAFSWLRYLSFTKQQLLDKMGTLYYACLLSRPVVRFTKPIRDLGSGARELHVVSSQSSRCNLSHFERAWMPEDVTQLFRTL
jgi:hypothetical protein